MNDVAEVKADLSKVEGVPRKRGKVQVKRGDAGNGAPERADDGNPGCHETDAEFAARLRAAINQAQADLGDAFVARADALALIGLAFVTGENFLLVGDPGTGKTALIARFLAHVEDARYFGALCGSFTTLDELVGPPDIAKFQRGEWGRVTAGMLPEAEFAFLDEVMKSNDGTINSLLSILNERSFAGAPIPLHCLGAATNWPEVRARTEKVEALYDRFLLRLHVRRTEGDDHTKMLVQAGKVRSFQPRVRWTVADLKRAGDLVDAVEVPEHVTKKLTEVVARLAKDQVEVSDRRAVKSLRVMQARAWLGGRQRVSISDFDALRYICWVNEADVQHIEAVVDTIDKELTKQVVDAIDQQRQAFKRFQGRPPTDRVSQASELLDSITQTAKWAKELLGGDNFTPPNHERVQKALGQLKDDFMTLREIAAKDVGLGKAGSP